jgi:hypothetical protein
VRAGGGRWTLLVSWGLVVSIAVAALIVAMASM